MGFIAVVNLTLVDLPGLTKVAVGMFLHSHVVGLSFVHVSWSILLNTIVCVDRGAAWKYQEIEDMVRSYAEKVICWEAENVFVDWQNLTMFLPFRDEKVELWELWSYLACKFCSRHFVGTNWQNFGSCIVAELYSFSYYPSQSGCCNIWCYKDCSRSWPNWYYFQIISGIIKHLPNFSCLCFFSHIWKILLRVIGALTCFHAGERTLGVLTKLDLMDKGTNALDVSLFSFLPNITIGFCLLKRCYISLY